VLLLAVLKLFCQQWSRKESEQEQVINTLAAQYDIAEKQRDVLQAVRVALILSNNQLKPGSKMLTEKTSALEAQEDALKRVIRNNLRESQELTQVCHTTSYRAKIIINAPWAEIKQDKPQAAAG
jgi:23S rRNA A2030 N6-methylase RlmJ